MRSIVRLDIKTNRLVKPFQFEGLRVLGDPNLYARAYCELGIDEIVLYDCVASLYRRNTLTGLLGEMVQDLFVPITVAGGVRSISDARELFKTGADKIAVNTAIVDRPQLLDELVQEFGAQSIVVQIDAKRVSSFCIESPCWNILTDGGREVRGLGSFEDWVQECQMRGAGEFMVTSVDRDGTQSGLDLELLAVLSSILYRPFMYGGGARDDSDIKKASSFMSESDGIVVGGALHYKRFSVADLKRWV